MNVEVFKSAQDAYARGDYKSALELFIACTDDVSGLSPADLSKFHHLIGNCYVKSNDPRSAAEYYLKALTGSPETRKPSLYVNLGTALLGTKDYQNALEAFGRALDYPIYTTPFKAYAGIGAAQLKLGNMVEAGAAYREAALDPSNPDPAKALVNLGVCFMELGRTDDAVSVYETALDFDMDDRALSQAYANLGQAYMAQGRIPRALEVFGKAEELGGELPQLAQHDYEIAKTIQEKLNSRAPGILDTGAIATVTVPSEEEEEEFDPFAPKTQAIELEDGAEQEELEEEEVSSSAQTLAMSAVAAGAAGAAAGAAAAGAIEAEAAEQIPGDYPEGQNFEQYPEGEYAPDGQYVEGAQPYESGLDERPFTYNEQPGYEYGVAFDFGDQYSDARTAPDRENSETYMPSPDNTAFFDVTEQEIAQGARDGKKKDRKARGCGLKIAIALVIVLILAALGAGGAYFVGYGYPLQETVASNFISAVQKGESTDKYWSSDVEQSMRKAQEAALANVSSYQVEAVERSMNQSQVYVAANLKEGGKIYYDIVMKRSGTSWVVDYIQLYFTSQR